MKIDEDKRIEFSKRLRKCADALSLGQSGNAPIRELQSRAQEILFASSDSYLRTICFLLDEWIRDYILNFAGDVVTPNSAGVDEVRERLLRENTARAMVQISDALDAVPEKIFAAVERLVVSYLDAIQEANRLVNEQK